MFWKEIQKDGITVNKLTILEDEYLIKPCTIEGNQNRKVVYLNERYLNMLESKDIEGARMEVMKGVYYTLIEKRNDIDEDIKSLMKLIFKGGKLRND